MTPPSARKKKASSPPVRKRRVDSQDTRDAILTAALAEFSMLGFEGASVRNIGKRADVDFTLITYYFGNKLTLWQEVIKRSGEKHTAAVSAPMPDNLTPGQQLRLRLSREYQFACSEDSMFYVVSNEMRAHDNERLHWFYEHFLQPAINRALPLLEAAQASGEIVEGDPLLLFELLQISMRALLSSSRSHQLITGQPADDPATQAQFWQLIERVFFSRVQPLASD
jgi:AcrR family transcriptional regulator